MNEQNDDAAPDARDVTHELSLAFRDSVEEPAAVLKGRVMAWLTAEGRSDFVESFVDGVEWSVDDGFSEEAATPVVLYDYDRQALVDLAAAARRAFGEALDTRLSILATSAWQQAWSETGASGESPPLRTERFVTARVPLHSAPCASERDTPLRDASGCFVLQIAPGSAFGQGDHATTEACLLALENWGEGRGSVLDVGTGTGVLAIAAARLGYGPLRGTDLDAAILTEARANARLNSVELALDLTAEIPPGPYRAIIANIPAPVLHDLMVAFAESLEPGGRLFLAGFVAKESARLTRAAGAAGLAPLGQIDVRGWAGLAFARMVSAAPLGLQ